ncbi:MAG: hypothetical protein RDV48_19065 [Candidatus Eremiobacteraeota bacterium]|nr:hypothetical protein [Candidatus Eremiobacteraeota bacterium]
MMTGINDNYRTALERIAQTRTIQFRSPAGEKAGEAEKPRGAADAYTQSDDLKDLEEEEGAGPQEKGGAKPQEGNAAPKGIFLGPDVNIPQYAGFADRMGSHMNQDGSLTALTDEEKKNLAMALSAYDIDTLTNLERTGLKFNMVDHRNPPPDGFPGGMKEWQSENLQGYYTPRDNAIVLKQEQMGSKPGTLGSLAGIDTARHETAHAIDDMLYPDGFLPIYGTDRDPKLQDMYQAYRNRAGQDQNNRFESYQWDKFNSKEYFACGVQAYEFSPETRQMLKEKDPELYAYVENYLNSSKDQSLPEKQEMPFLGKVADGIGQVVKGIGDFIGGIVKGIGDFIGGIFGGGKGQG